MSEPYLPGPDRETLKKLAADLPGMISDLEDQRSLKGKRSANLAKPTRVCKVCGRGYDHKLISGGLPELGQCGHCTELLRGGHIGFVCDNRYAFVSSKNSKGEIIEDVVGWAGNVVLCTPDHMDRLELRFKVQAQKKSSAEASQN